jgi:hypothetical protein
LDKGLAKLHVVCAGLGGSPQPISDPAPLSQFYPPETGQAATDGEIRVFCLGKIACFKIPHYIPLRGFLSDDRDQEGPEVPDSGAGDTTREALGEIIGGEEVRAHET